MTTAAELRDLDEVELLDQLTQSKQELFNLRFQHVTGQLDNAARLGQLRKDIARINTVLRERELDELPTGSEDEPDAEPHAEEEG